MKSARLPSSAIADLRWSLPAPGKPIEEQPFDTAKDCGRIQHRDNCHQEKSPPEISPKRRWITESIPTNGYHSSGRQHCQPKSDWYPEQPWVDEEKCNAYQNETEITSQNRSLPTSPESGTNVIAGVNQKTMERC